MKSTGENAPSGLPIALPLAAWPGLSSWKLPKKNPHVDFWTEHRQFLQFRVFCKMVSQAPSHNDILPLSLSPSLSETFAVMQDSGVPQR